MAFVDQVFENFRDPKQALVAWIGAVVGRCCRTFNRGYFESNLERVVEMFMKKNRRGTC